MSLAEDLPTSEPRNTFLNFVIHNIQRIQELIFYHRRPLTAISPLRGLIAALDNKSKKKLEQYHAQLILFEENPKQASRQDIEDIFWKVLTYLHQTYLSEISKGIIAAATLKATQKTPEPKIYKKTLSADVE